MRCLGWNLLPPLIKIFLKKEDKSLKECLSIFDYLLKVCFVFGSEIFVKIDLLLTCEMSVALGAITV